MLGKHIVQQPLHVTLVRYRIIAVSSISFIGYMMFVAWTFFEASHTTLSAAGAAGFFTYVGALLTAFVKCVQNIQVRHEE